MKGTGKQRFKKSDEKIKKKRKQKQTRFKILLKSLTTR